jgi:hypothetical protein
MKLQTAQRKRVKIKMGLQGPSGSGKTMSALLTALGLCNNWSKIAVIDTENHSAELYAHLGSYNVLPISPPFTPEKYIEALGVCQDAGMEVIIIDSLTHEWEYLLDYHSSLQGNSFANWSKVTPRHNEFVQKILQSSAHVIATMRTKQDYVLSEKNGKMVPEKVGLKTVQRDGMDYEFTLVFDLDIKNNATSSKDRTGMFFGKPEHKLSFETGKLINEWCNNGITVGEIIDKIQKCKTVPELVNLYKAHVEYQVILKSEFEQKKNVIITNENTENTFSGLTFMPNGRS